ncbi:hypothetical protein HDU93_001424, partial [Gonapodya sp. JEL0774]
HTYCPTCASTFLDASLSGPRCELCAAAAPYNPPAPPGTPRPTVFANPAYLSIAEHISSRGDLVKGLGSWVAGLATTIEEVKRLRESLKVAVTSARRRESAATSMSEEGTRRREDSIVEYGEEDVEGSVGGTT